MSSPWFLFCTEQNRRAAKLRLFCFHYAGSGGSMFRSWTKWLLPEVDLVAVQLPGRENRLDEPLVYSMDLVTSPLADALPPLLDRPFAFFGHSTGALIGFELARVLRQRGLPEPQLLIASGQEAPQVKPVRVRHRLPDAEFIEVLRGCDGTPDVVLSNPALLELLLPRIRADGAVYETYQYKHQAHLDCRIVVFRGLQDTMVRSSGITGWKLETRGSFRCHGFPGGHFFVQEREREVVEQVNHELEEILEPTRHHVGNIGPC